MRGVRDDLLPSPDRAVAAGPGRRRTSARRRRL